MADGTHIEWADATWNPITGCSVISPGCTNCYAMRMAGTRLRDHPSRKGLTVDSKAGSVWTGETRFNDQWLDEPLRWRKPRRIFVGAHTDIFHESVPDAWLDQIFAVMRMTPQHTYQLLTKRPERMRDYIRDRFRLSPEIMDFYRQPGEPLAEGWQFLPNAWLGVSIEDQARADERISILLDTPAAIRWVSAEPLLGPVNLEAYLGAVCTHEDGYVEWDTNATVCRECEETNLLDWVVAGGESGPGARPMHPDWVRQIRDDCAAAGVPFLFKQWGEWAPILDRDRDDPEWQRCSQVVREHPKGRWLNLAGGHGFHGECVHYFDHVGKRATGRTLDGVIHDAYPARRS